MFAADIVILAVYDGSSLSQWRADISINTIVSTISTVAMFTLMNPLGAAVGQCKWILFRRSQQPLIYYAHLDAASRGPFGSLKLFLGRKWYGTLPALGALLTIMTLAVNPFMQQLIRIDVRDTTTEGAFLPTAIEHTSVSGDSLSADLNMKAAAYAGFVGPLSSVYNISSVCPSGNCTWEPFETLAVCSSCANITDQMGGSPDFRLNLSNGFQLASRSAYYGAHTADQKFLNVTTTKKLYDSLYSGVGEYNTYTRNNMSLIYADRGSLIIDFLVLRAPQLNLETSSAHECVLQYCVKTISASQLSGELIETEVSTWTNDSESARLTADNSILTTPIEGANTSYDAQSTVPEYYLKPTEKIHTFTVALVAQLQMTSWFNGILQGNATYEWPRTGAVYSNDQIQGVDTSVDGGDPGLSQLMSNVAKAMTVALRSSSKETASGVIHRNETYIHIRWPWIALPLAIYLLVATFLALVALASRDHDQPVHVWKNSGVSALLHGFDAEPLRQKLGPLHDQSEIDRAAKAIQVRLVPGIHGLHFEAEERKRAACASSSEVSNR